MVSLYKSIKSGDIDEVKRLVEKYYKDYDINNSLLSLILNLDKNSFVFSLR